VHGGRGDGSSEVVELVEGVLSGEGGRGKVAVGLLLVAAPLPPVGEEDGLQ
jgi:hypothetical protein